MWLDPPVAAYFIGISLMAVVLPAVDKHAARKKRWRIPEAVLMAFAVIGGGPAMYVTLLLIRHKTNKPKFMVGIPLIVFAEIALYVWMT